MKIYVMALLTVCLAKVAFASDIPRKLSILPVGEDLRGEVIVVAPPQEIQVYIRKVEEAAQKDPDFFSQHVKTVPTGTPLPYHEKLGLSQEEYQVYMELWKQREYKVLEDVSIHLDETKEGQWVIRVSGRGAPISLMSYDGESFYSPNGKLLAIEDIKAPEHSILGAWSGHEWRYQEETLLGNTRENIAIGKLSSHDYGLLVYRLQEATSSGRVLIDHSVVVRFPLKRKD